MKTDSGLHESAVSAVNAAYQRMDPWKSRRRPIRSAHRPTTSDPTSDPARADAAIQPWAVPDRFHSAVKTGRTKPTRRISMATNVQAIPVKKTARRWNGVKPPSRRTSSTSRVATPRGSASRTGHAATARAGELVHRGDGRAVGHLQVLERLVLVHALEAQTASLGTPIAKPFRSAP